MTRALRSRGMDLGKLLQDVVTSPITLAVASAVAFVLGLMARPYIEARSGLFKERVTARTAFQRETLTEMQTTVTSLDHRLIFEPLDYDEADSIREGQRQTVAAHRLRILTNQVRDPRVVAAMTRFLGFSEGDEFFDANDPRAYDNAYNAVLDRAHAAIANALRDL
jgi:hypothetical protein